MPDIYFEEAYGKLYEEIEGGVCETFEFTHSLGSVKHLFIKRKIEIEPDGAAYYDLTTPYGYGGPLMFCENIADRPVLAKEFQKAFQQYCQDRNIVSEFVRFHPVFSNEQDFGEMYEVVWRRKTVGTNLADFENPVQSEFSKSAKENIKRALKAGIETRVTRHPKSLKLFKEFYYKTLQKNHAEDIYFFTDEYFEKCLALLGPSILLVEALYKGEVIGMIMNFVHGDYVHIHLSGTLQETIHLSPVYIMMQTLTIWAKEQNMKLIHSGGGRTASPDDKLFQFKKRFGKHTEFDYYFGYKIWNPTVYERLTAAVGAVPPNPCFPAYRAPATKEVG
ncbi:FemAB family protein [Planococcus massiliensis]|uniref:Lipid II:glycine glycyltransferase n=1 Tax=Planococcus massiliensis TaxID=1499687 RepID=A0A098EJS5_9BACL|nr:GNAT family N-acetyltransferase [Planococcus massiliensis]CEG22092.1 FemAB family protein [Planococcus massiliensis]